MIKMNTKNNELNMKEVKMDLEKKEIIIKDLMNKNK